MITTNRLTVGAQLEGQAPPDDGTGDLAPEDQQAARQRALARLHQGELPDANKQFSATPKLLDPQAVKRPTLLGDR